MEANSPSETSWESSVHQEPGDRNVLQICITEVTKEQQDAGDTCENVQQFILTAIVATYSI